MKQLEISVAIYCSCSAKPVFLRFMQDSVADSCVLTTSPCCLKPKQVTIKRVTMIEDHVS